MRKTAPAIGPTIVPAPPISAATMMVKTKLMSKSARGAMEPM